MTTALSGHDIADKLRATLPDAVEESRDEWVVVSPDAIADVCRLLRDDDETDFQMLRSSTPSISSTGSSSGTACSPSAATRKRHSRFACGAGMSSACRP